jgi:thiamine-phosphate diphosphorylase
MDLQIPPGMGSLQKEINRVVLIAQRQGFTIPDISVHISRGKDFTSVNIPYKKIGIFVTDDGLSFEDSFAAAEAFKQCVCSDIYQIQYCQTIANLSSKFTYSRSTPSSFTSCTGHTLIQVARQCFTGQISERWNLTHCFDSSDYLNASDFFDPNDIFQSLSAPEAGIVIVDSDFRSTHLSWMIVLLLLDFPLEDVLIIARAALSVSRETWPSNIENFPRVNSELLRQWPKQNLYFNPMNSMKVGLYPVVDDVKWIERLLKLGVKLIQLRIKDEKQTDLESQIRRAIELGKTYDGQVFINDYWQLALKYKAYGIHLGQEDLIDADLSSIRDAGIRLGISTHSYWEILKVYALTPSYIALGHIFPTTTKQMPSKPQGLIRLKLYQKLIKSIVVPCSQSIPTVAIGGIDLSNAASVWKQGVSSLAVVRAVTQAQNVDETIKQFDQIIQTHREEDHVTSQ